MFSPYSPLYWHFERGRSWEAAQALATLQVLEDGLTLSELP